ncbi:MAG TPA: diguanylate cyclase [Gemmatimonadales bacterium]|jgi:diguanylate cyclase (GGDEF)-like protein|nr:diguanylate cyclase [Gemmatimonadales bacterium]
MDSSPTLPALATLPSAFAAACRHSRTDSELFERCREALVRRFNSDRIWLSVNAPNGVRPVVAPSPEWVASAKEVTRLSSGQTEVIVHADPEVARQMASAAVPIALGLAVMVELHSVLRERQEALEDAAFQLRALRQVARLLSSVHSSEETENLILDFMTEVFFAWWACLYRPQADAYIPKVFRSLKGPMALTPIDLAALDKELPSGTPALSTADTALARLLPSNTQLAVTLDAGVERLAVLALGPRLHEQGYGAPEYELAGTLAFAAAIALKNAHLVEQLQSAATTDPLTSLGNRRAMEERLDAELSRGRRHSLHTSVVLVDVDRFKLVNDTLGHAAGDRLLVLIGQILRQQCRTLDAVGRMGGDEYLVILPMTTAEEAMAFISRVQSSVAALERSHPEFGRPSLSMGIAEAPRHGASPSTLLAGADSALYRAKRGGRNAVEVAEDM